MDLDAALREALAREGEPAYLLDRRGDIQFVNDAWDRAARAEGAPDRVHAEAIVGTNWLEGICGKARRYYAAVLSRAFSLPLSTPPLALVHLTECNSPVTVRTVSHRFVPLFGERELSAGWVLVVHTPVAETAADRHYAIIHAGPSRYAQADGNAHQCTACRRTLTGADLGGEPRWEFAPALISQPPEGTHWRICPDCRVRYFVKPSEEPLRHTVAARLPRSAGLWLSARQLAVMRPTG